MLDFFGKQDRNQKEPEDQRIYGVTIGMVINNLDPMKQARVQVKLPWLPGFEPWARVAALMAGMNRGTYFMPMVGDEVLVAFNHGDVRDPFVIGGLWNSTDFPPILSPTDAFNKRLIRSPLGHTIEIDDLLQSITITTNTQQKITLDPTKVQISTTGGAASVQLDTAGSVTIQAALSLTLKAPTITIEGATVDVKGTASTSINGGAACNIQAAMVKIN